MINWPDSLIDELAARRCVIFIGSGTSASATIKGPNNETISPPTWDRLLEILLEKCHEDQDGSKEKANELLQNQKYLDCAELIRHNCMQPADYNRSIESIFSGYNPTEIHKAVLSLDQKIVFTTNFDRIYEHLCLRDEGRDGYVALNYYDDGLIARMRSPKRIIVKVHGCAGTPEHTILTKSDFFKARSKYPGFFSALESIFLTHTILFIGYSVNDPEIQLILENNIITYPSDNPHYATMSKGMHRTMIAAFKKTNNISVLEYDSADNHIQLVESLKELCVQVEDRRQYQG
ncbi:SIR2 family protein [Salmonella enterica subsp. enterica serovar Infantis]|nr:SIR2 family protein [Salmonella enterica subsp. enterica serovar Infantis]